MEASIMMIGQKIVVVGGTAGIGLAVARNAADCGAEVYIGSSNAQKLESPLRALQSVRGAVIDVGNEESVAHFFSGISEIDHLVSTVGPSHQPAPVTQAQLEEAQALSRLSFGGNF
jgi:NAD(P)-dependent dehydrogenase (short-subunit alcohol dehydrogenase family)